MVSNSSGEGTPQLLIASHPEEEHSEIKPLLLHIKHPPKLFNYFISSFNSARLVVLMKKEQELKKLFTDVDQQTMIG